MPTSCFVPGCSSNYRNSDSVSVFQFPNDDTVREKWIRAIHRVGFRPSNRSVVCIHHFDEKYIVREDSMVRADGSVLTLQRSRVKLTDDSVPTQFPNLPVYGATSLLKPRKNPNQRQAVIEECLVEAEAACAAQMEDEPLMDVPSAFGGACRTVIKVAPEIGDEGATGLCTANDHSDMPVELESDPISIESISMDEDDMLYFKSLVPDLIKLTPALKQKFRIKVRNILKELTT